MIKKRKSGQSVGKPEKNLLRKLKSNCKCLSFRGVWFKKFKTFKRTSPSRIYGDSIAFFRRLYIILD